MNDDDLRAIWRDASAAEPSDRSRCLTDVEWAQLLSPDAKDAARERASEHIAQCAACADEYRLLLPLQSWHSAAEEALLPKDLAGARRGGQAERAGWRNAWIGWWRWPYVVAAVVVLLVSTRLVMWRLGEHASPKARVAVQQAEADHTKSPDTQQPRATVRDQKPRNGPTTSDLERMKIGPESTRALTARAPGPAEDERRSQAQAEVARARREAVAALEKSRRDELARVTEQVAASEKAVTAPAAVGQVQVDPARQPAQQPPIHTGSVQAVLDAWAAGYNSRDVDAVAAVFVLSPEARQRLAEAFAQASSYERTLQDCRILQIATNRASVHCRVHTHVVTRAGGAFNPIEPLTFTLERRGDGWIITKIALTRVE